MKNWLLLLATSGAKTKFVVPFVSIPTSTSCLSFWKNPYRPYLFALLVILEESVPSLPLRLIGKLYEEVGTVRILPE